MMRDDEQNNEGVGGAPKICQSLQDCQTNMMSSEGVLCTFEKLFRINV